MKRKYRLMLLKAGPKWIKLNGEKKLKKVREIIFKNYIFTMVLTNTV